MVTTVAVADYRAGVEAYRQSQYDVALREWMQIATSPPNEVNPAVRAESSYAVGMLFWMGQGVPQDTATAATWLEKAAELNHAEAQSKLGYLYLTGDGVERNEFVAMKWLNMAANQGSPDAQYNLGVCYRDGIGTEADAERALYWFHEAASNGDPISAAIVERYNATGVLESSPQTETANIEPHSIHGEAWILAQQPAHYTIQVMAISSPEKLESLALQHPELAPMAIYRVARTGAALHALVQGDFVNAGEARAARDRIPRALQSPEEVWIRQFAAIQAQIGGQRDAPAPGDPN